MRSPLNLNHFCPFSASHRTLASTDSKTATTNRQVHTTRRDELLLLSLSLRTLADSLRPGPSSLAAIEVSPPSHGADHSVLLLQNQPLRPLYLPMPRRVTHLPHLRARRGVHLQSPRQPGPQVRLGLVLDHGSVRHRCRAVRGGACDMAARAAATRAASGGRDRGAHGNLRGVVRADCG